MILLVPRATVFKSSLTAAAISALAMAARFFSSLARMLRVRVSGSVVVWVWVGGWVGWWVPVGGGGGGGGGGVRGVGVGLGLELGWGWMWGWGGGRG